MGMPSKNIAAFATFSANNTIRDIQERIRQGAGVGGVGDPARYGCSGFSSSGAASDAEAGGGESARTGGVDGDCSGFSTEGAASWTGWADDGGSSDKVKACGSEDSGGENAKTWGVEGESTGAGRDERVDGVIQTLNSVCEMGES